jgi:hypothetical protein
MYLVEQVLPATGIKLPTQSAGDHDEAIATARKKIADLTRLGWVLVAYAEPIDGPEGHLRIFEARNGTRIEVRLRPIGGGPCRPRRRACPREEA